MKRKTLAMLQAAYQNAPVLLIPFRGKRSVVAERGSEQEREWKGIVSQSPIGVFLQEVFFWAESQAFRAGYYRRELAHV